MLPTRFAWPSFVEALETRRLLAAGALDKSFSDDGIASASGSFTATDVAVQADGKAVVAGFETGRTFVDHTVEKLFAVARYNLDGTLDATFGTGGLVHTQLSNLDVSSADAVAIGQFRHQARQVLEHVLHVSRHIGRQLSRVRGLQRLSP